MPLRKQKATRRARSRGYSSPIRACHGPLLGPGMAPAHCYATQRPTKLGHMAFIPLHRVLCSWLAVARRALIKSLPGQELKTGSNLRAFNKENRPETRKGNFRARPGPALSLLVSPSMQGLCGLFFFFFGHSGLSHALLAGFVISGSHFNTQVTILLVLLERKRKRLFSLVYLSFLRRLLHPSSQL